MNPHRTCTALLLKLLTIAPNDTGASDNDRARDLGIPFEGDTGPLNAITDVAGVAVGHVTLDRG